MVSGSMPSKITGHTQKWGKRTSVFWLFSYIEAWTKNDTNDEANKKKIAYRQILETEEILFVIVSKATPHRKSIFLCNKKKVLSKYLLCNCNRAADTSCLM